MRNSRRVRPSARLRPPRAAPRGPARSADAKRDASTPRPDSPSLSPERLACPPKLSQNQCVCSEACTHCILTSLYTIAPVCIPRPSARCTNTYDIIVGRRGAYSYLINITFGLCVCWFVSFGTVEEDSGPVADEVPLDRESRVFSFHTVVGRQSSVSVRSVVCPSDKLVTLDCLVYYPLHAQHGVLLSLLI